MTERELLISTVQFYTSCNRAFESDTNHCVYIKTDASPGCAIGRHLTQANQMTFHEMPKNNSITTICQNPETAKLLPDWMQKISVDFLQEVQNLHDGEKYWDEFGISGIGKKEVNKICNDYDLNLLTEEEFQHE